MPTRLPNGVLIFNATTHDLFFDVNGVEVTVKQDGVLHAGIIYTVEKRTEHYEIVSGQRFTQLLTGKEMIRKAREQHPEVLIVGSAIAAQAYPGEVVACVPVQRRHDRGAVNKRIMRSDRFTSFKKETNNHA